MIEFIIMVLHNYLKEMSIKHEIQWKEKHFKIEYFGQFFCMSIKRLHMVYATSYTVEWGWSLEIHTWQKPPPYFLASTLYHVSVEFCIVSNILDNCQESFAYWKWAFERLLWSCKVVSKRYVLTLNPMRQKYLKRVLK